MIYYTTDGTEPTTSSPVYSAPVAISRSTTLDAFATAPGYATSYYNFGAYYITSVPDSFLYSVAGTEGGGYSGDNGPATLAQLSYPRATAIDANGNIYVAESGNSVVRRIDATTGIITTIAGTGFPGYTGDNGPADRAQLDAPFGVAFDPAGDLYVSDNGANVIRKITMSTGIITTYAGGASTGVLGDNGPATAAVVSLPQGIAFDAAGNLYIAQTARVRKVAAQTQIITTVAGGGGALTSPYGDGGPAVDATLQGPVAVALDSSSNLYIADQILNSVRKVTAATGVITTVAGTPGYGNGSSGDGGPAIAAKLSWPSAVAVDSAGDLYIGDTDNLRIREVNASTGIITTVAGNSDIVCVSAIEDGARATAGGICNGSGGFSFDKSGDLFYADLNMVKELTHLGTPPSAPTAAPAFSVSGGTYSTSQTVSLSDSTPGATIHVTINPQPVENQGEPAIVTEGLAYRRPINVVGGVTIGAVAVAPGHIPSPAVVNTYTISTPPASIVETIAGGGTTPFPSSSGGPATMAILGESSAIASDASGNLFLADVSNNVVWRIDAASGVITVFGGNGSAGTGNSFGDNGPATSANLSYPDGLAVDSAGNVYISDEEHYEVREVLASNGNIVPYAGNGSHTSTGNNGDGGPATSAFLVGPGSLAIDPQGNLYIVSDLAIREVLASTGIIQTAAGGPDNTTLGDGGPATSAQISADTIALDSSFNLYIAGGGRIRVVNAKTGIINTIAGDGVGRSDGDGLLATQAEIEPTGLGLDANGDVYITDEDLNIREIDAKTGVISRIAGMDFEGNTGDGGPPLVATMCPAYGIVLDGSGNLYFPDVCGLTVRQITSSVPAPAPTINPPAGTYSSAQSVTFSDSATIYSIHYTTDGTTPTTKSALYSGPISVAKSETLKAMATASGYSASSGVVSAAYIIQATPAIGLTSSANPADASQSITFTATVSSTAGTPSGSVAFFDGTTKLGSGTLASGKATFSTASLAAGSHTITAQYAGDSNFLPATSGALTQTVNAFAIALASGASSSASVSAGGTATYKLTVTPPGNSPVSLSVTGLPSGATSSFTPSTVAAASPATAVTVSITVRSQSAAIVPDRPGHPSRTPLLLGLALLPLLGWRRLRNLHHGAFMVLLSVAVMAGMAFLTGCGGGGSKSRGGGGQQQPQTYDLSVKATAGSVTQSISLTLTVE